MFWIHFLMQCEDQRKTLMGVMSLNEVTRIYLSLANEWVIMHHRFKLPGLPTVEPAQGYNR
jgi:hypothetical protein